MLKNTTCPFDHHSHEYAQHAPEIYRELRETAPVEWTDSHGGFWVISRHEDVVFAAQNPEIFSSHHDLEGDSPFGGIGIPPVSKTVQILPQELDPPELLKYRRMLQPIFNLKSVEPMRPMISELVQWMIDQHIERGEAELVADIATPLPAYISMKWLGLPPEHWHGTLGVLTDISHTPQHDPHYAEVMAAVASVRESFRAEVHARRVGSGEDTTSYQPGDDVLSYLINAKLDGEPIPEERLVSLLFVLLAAGSDTMSQLLGSSFVYLGEHTDDRERLKRDPSLLRPACEELLRFYSVAMVNARTVTRDVTLGGQQLRAGDRVLLSWWSANHDEEVFEDPDTVVFSRSPNPHAAFGLGAHRCLGSHLARATFETFFGHFLERMGDYELIASEVKAYEFTPVHFGYERVPVRFPPGSRVGARNPFDQ